MDRNKSSTRDDSPFLEHEHYSDSNREESKYITETTYDPKGTLVLSKEATTHLSHNPSYYEDTESEASEQVDPDENIPLVKSLKTDWSQFTGAVYNLTNSTIGSGVLALPFVIKQCGLLPGISFLFIFACITSYSLHLLHKSSLILLQKNIPTFNRDYEDIARLLHSDFGSIFVKLCIIINNFGACISYLVIIGDLLVPALTNWFGDDFPPHWFWNDIIFTRTFLVSLITFSFLLPLSLYSKMSSLKFTSLLSLFAVIAFIIAVVFYYIHQVATGDKEDESDSDNNSIALSFGADWNSVKDVIVVLPIITFAFACHANLLPISREFTRPVIMSWAIPSSTFGFSLTSYLVVAIFGYLTFLKDTEPNLIKSYPTDSILLGIIRIIMTISIMLTYPMVSFPCRYSLDNLLFPSKTTAPNWIKNFPLLKNGTKDKVGNWMIKNPTNRTVIEATLIAVCALILSILFPSVSRVFSLTGSTGSTFTSYILPAWFYMMLSSSKIYSYVLDTDVTGRTGGKYVLVIRKERRWIENIKFVFQEWDIHWHKPIALLLLVSGIVFGVVATSTTISSMIYDIIENGSEGE
eukprot:TRINITY_DN1414_c0_g1_i1.p1 TRINITY_DN1414_c0_g1~~TRINITY_DN1414_c0_g1_i1.p1  ORF type:complete len:579 (-),score=108.38 TRINITY_DN1414_c0_g1_i1:11-1747(-)